MLEQDQLSHIHAVAVSAFTAYRSHERANAIPRIQSQLMCVVSALQVLRSDFGTNFFV